MESFFLTRRVTFDAQHRYHRSDWSHAENQRVFGEANAPYHGHTYTCAVTVTGPVDPASGTLVDLQTLDRILDREVVRRFHGKRINDDVPEFRGGMIPPTGENMARFIFDRVAAKLSDGVRVSEVTVAEDATLSATYRSDPTR
jgi:6-pyruvoyltetrahydropterin/6-carboxytetrahydropterin synthase